MEIWQRDNRNLIIFPDGNEEFSLTGYKVLTNQGKSGFAECRKILFNGRHQFWYDIEYYESLGELLPKLRRGQISLIMQDMAQIICRIEENGFLDIGNILIDLSDIYVDPDTFDVHLVYLPVSGRAPADQDVMVGDFLNEVGRLNMDNEPIKEELSAVWASRSFEELKTATAPGSIPAHKAAAFTAEHQSGVPVTGQKPRDDGETERLAQQDNKLKGGFLGRMFGRNGGRTQKTDVFLDSSMPEDSKPGPAPVPASISERTDTLVLSGTSAGQTLTFCIDSDAFRLGKKRESVDGCIDTSPAVSRIHCEIQRRDGEFYIHDLESANGTFVNGIRLNAGREFSLHRGDKLRLADVELGVL